MRLRKAVRCLSLLVLTILVIGRVLYCSMWPTIDLCISVEQVGGYVTFESFAPEWWPDSVRSWRLFQVVTRVQCSSHWRDSRGRIVGRDGSKKFRDARVIEKVLAVRSVKGLYLGYSELSAADFRVLGTAKNLVELSLSGQTVDDDRLGDLSQNGNWRFLQLRDTSVSDVGVEHLVKMKELKILDVSGTNVTDAGLHALMSCPALATLEIHSTPTTSKGIKECQTARPDISFQYDRKKKAHPVFGGLVVQ